MARFTATAPLNIRWLGNDISGAAGATHRIPDALYDEFNAAYAGVIPGLTWVTQDETSAFATLPIGQTDVTGLTAALAAKAPLASPTFTGTVSAAAISTPLMTAAVAHFKGSPWHDIRAYGAVGDNVADDTAAIQAAANALGASGGTIYVPSGTYKITGTITIGAASAGAIRVVGEGGGTSAGPSVLNMTTLSTRALALLCAEAWLEHLVVKGPGGSPTVSEGIYSTVNAHLLDVVVFGFYYGIRFNGAGSFYSTVTDCRFQSNTIAGMKVDAGSNNLTVLNTRTSGGAQGILAAQCASLRVIGGAFEQHTGFPVYIDGASRGVLLTGIYFETTTAAGSPGANIFLGDTALVAGAIISGCYFAADAGVAGFRHIRTTNVQGLVIQGNAFHSATGGAFLFSAGTNGVTIMENYNTGTLGTITAAAAVSFVGAGLGRMPTTLPIRTAATTALTLGTVYADIVGATTTFTPNTAETVVVTAIFDMNYTVAGAADALGQLVVDGVAETPVARLNVASTVTGRVTISQRWVVSLTAAVSHTLKLQGAKSAAAATIIVESANTGIIVERYAA